MRDLESEWTKFFRMDAQSVICLLHGKPNCITCSHVYLALAFPQILMQLRVSLKDFFLRRR